MEARGVDLLGQLDKLITDRLSPAEFIHWFNSARWEIESSDCVEVMTLADDVENRVAEYTGGYISSDLLKQTLAADLAIYRAQHVLA